MHGPASFFRFVSWFIQPQIQNCAKNGFTFLIAEMVAGIQKYYILNAWPTCLAPAPKETYKVDCNTAEMWTMFILTLCNYMILYVCHVCVLFLSLPIPRTGDQGGGETKPLGLK